MHAFIFDFLTFSPSRKSKALSSLLSLEIPLGFEDSVLLADIQGPYAFIYYHASSERLFFGRDPLGRRSLLVHVPLSYSSSKKLFSPQTLQALDDEEEKEGDLGGEGHVAVASGSEMVSTDDHLIISSSAILPHDHAMSRDQADFWQEIPISGFFSWSFTTRSASFHPWPEGRLSFFNPRQPDLPTVKKFSSIGEASDALMALLRSGVRLRVSTIPKHSQGEGSRVGILFSGGLDCMVLAALTSLEIPEEESIDLINVCFEEERHASPDRLAAVAGLQELKVTGSFTITLC